MQRMVETHQFGPHRVVVLEHAGDEETMYSILVDDVLVTETPLPSPPRFEDVVRIYARSQGHDAAEDSKAAKAAEAAKDAKDAKDHDSRRAG